MGYTTRNGFGSVGACPRKSYAHKGLHYLKLFGEKP